MQDLFLSTNLSSTVSKDELNFWSVSNVTKQLKTLQLRYKDKGHLMLL
jgi:hypothetical protein